MYLIFVIDFIREDAKNFHKKKKFLNFFTSIYNKFFRIQIQFQIIKILHQFSIIFHKKSNYYTTVSTLIQRICIARHIIFLMDFISEDISFISREYFKSKVKGKNVKLQKSRDVRKNGRN